MSLNFHVLKHIFISLRPHVLGHVFMSLGLHILGILGQGKFYKAMCKCPLAHKQALGL
jgi:hypothetical protein